MDVDETFFGTLVSNTCTMQVIVLDAPISFANEISTEDNLTCQYPYIIYICISLKAWWTDTIILVHKLEAYKVELSKYYSW